MKKFHEFVLHRASVAVTLSRCICRRYKERLLARCQRLARCCGAPRAPPGRSAPAPSSETARLSRADCSVPLVTFVFLPFTFFLFVLFPESSVLPAPHAVPRIWVCCQFTRATAALLRHFSPDASTAPATLLTAVCQEARRADLLLCVQPSSSVRDPRSG